MFEPRNGGRVYERTPDGTEHAWGEVLDYEPPYRLAYTWHIGRELADATEVEISFAEDGETTIVTIVHRGWERLGKAGAEIREGNRRGRAGLLPHFQRACLEFPAPRAAG